MFTLGRDARRFNVRFVQRLGVGLASGLLAACGATSEGDTRGPGGKTVDERECEGDACSEDVAAVDTNTPKTPCPNDDAVARRDITGTHLLLAAPAGTGATPGPTPAVPPSVAPPPPNPVPVLPPPNYCGDGQVNTPEQCDDGNGSAGDGCDSLCSVEPGYLCTSSGQPCVYVVVCGDGLVGASEACDDGNALGGDGCSAGCDAVQAGYACAPGRACQEVCGDGILTPSEGCEDGNVTSGDGCNAACRLEPGYTCFYQNDFPTLAQDMGAAGASGEAEPVAPPPEAEPPLNCVATLCGDGITAGGEVCDDGNNLDGDGCRADCSVEPACDDSGACATVCGDALLIAGADEECDDGNAFNGDGCDAFCRMEPGFVCDVVPDMWDAALPPLYAGSLGHSQCSSVCGDGIAVAAEVCDDGAMNDAGYGFCGAACSAGPRCGDGVAQTTSEECDNGVNSSPYYDADVGCAPGCVFSSFCGDSVVDSGYGEECDLGAEQNDGAIGGCSNACEVVTSCGDGRVQSSQGETCDDGNTRAGDGCDTMCRFEVSGAVDGPVPAVPTDDVFVPPPNPEPAVSGAPLPNPCL